MLAFDPVQFLMIAATFLVAFGLLWKIAYKPLNIMLANREQQIKENIDKAEANRKSMECLKADYEKKLAEFEHKVQEMIKEATKLANATKDDILKEAREEAKVILAKTEQRLAYEREQVMKELKHEIANISLNITERVLKQSVDKNMHAKLVDDYLKELEKIKV